MSNIGLIKIFWVKLYFVTIILNYGICGTHTSNGYGIIMLYF